MTNKMKKARHEVDWEHLRWSYRAQSKLKMQEEMQKTQLELELITRMVQTKENMDLNETQLMELDQDLQFIVDFQQKLTSCVALNLDTLDLLHESLELSEKLKTKIQKKEFLLETRQHGVNFFF